MAKRYRPVDRDQLFLLPPDMRGWLPADHPVWLVITAVEGHLDTSAFHAARRTGHAGTAGYDPDMLLALLFWAYVNGITSSRQIEAACWTDVAFRVICARDVPGYVTICRFREAFPGSVEELFAEVLALCARLGMGKLGTIALDGTKIAANASKSANRTEETLRKMAADLVAAHAAADAAEDALFGEGVRGDEVPPEAASPRTRDERIAAALAQLEAERLAAEAAERARGQAYLQAAAGGNPLPGAVPAVAAVAAAEARLERARAAQQARAEQWQQRREAEKAAPGLRRGPGGCRPASPAEEHFSVRRAAAALDKARQRADQAERRAAARKGPGPVRNITDPDSRLMPTRNGFIQGYNPQNMISQDKLIIATELTQDTVDTDWLIPMLAAALEAADLINRNRAAGAAATAKPCTCPGPGGTPAAVPRSDCAPHPAGIGQLLADAGYLSEDNITAPGPDRLIATGKARALEKAARGQDAGQPPWRSEAIAAMAARLATPEGIAAYRQRGHIAETPHGHIKHNMGFRQLSLRGKPKAAAEWKFACAAYNLAKAITTGHLTAQALAALTTGAS
jgi:transposase